MDPSTFRRRLALTLALFAVSLVALFLWVRFATAHVAVPARRLAAIEAPAPMPLEPPSPPAAPRALFAAPPPATADATDSRPSKSDAPDTCKPVVEPELPEGYESTSVLGVTLAWPPGAAPIEEPTAFGYLVAGLLQEAARLTGAMPRERVTVIVYPHQVFHYLSGAPSCAAGFYDGAVKVPTRPGRPFGVALEVLRHELMHAELHAAVGCAPVWFHEGVAQRFASELDERTWVDMVRRRATLPASALEVASVEETGADRGLVYAQSLAMVLSLEDRASDAIAAAVRGMRERAGRGERKEDRLRLWSRLGGGDTRELLPYLARRLFGTVNERDLAEIFQGAVCCWGATLASFGCRGAPIAPGKRVWFDDSKAPSALCTLD